MIDLLSMLHSDNWQNIREWIWGGLSPKKSINMDWAYFGIFVINMLKYLNESTIIFYHQKF